MRIAEAKGAGAPSSTAGVYADSTLEALAQDHWNDCLSNAVAAAALLCALSNDRLWVLDPIGAVIISLYIIFSWYSTGREQIEQLTGKAAPAEFIDELYETANNFDPKMEVSHLSIALVRRSFEFFSLISSSLGSVPKLAISSFEILFLARPLDPLKVTFMIGI